MDEINIENLKKLDIKKIALNPDLGILNFENIEPTLESLRNLLVEIIDLNYESNVSSGEISLVNNSLNQFIDYLKQLQDFNIGQENSQGIHDNLENAIRSFYDSTTQQLRTIITYLRLQATSATIDQKELKKQQKNAALAKKEYEELLGQLKLQIQGLNKRQKEVENKKGKIASTTLSIYFAQEVAENDREAKNWLKLRNYALKILFILAIINATLFFVILIADKFFNWKTLMDSDIFNIQYGLINSVIISLVSYFMIFSSKNFTVRSNLSAINRHRRNVALTLDDFLGTNPEKEVRDQMVKQATEAMFKQFPAGYLGKNEAKDGGPIGEIINYFLPK